MAIDKKQKDRNYLYGRLLAVADRIEYRTYDDGDKASCVAAAHIKKSFMTPFLQ